MAVRNLAQFEEKPYDPRWFVWTIVFLIVSGVSLVSYILITTSNDDASNGYIPLIHIVRSSHSTSPSKTK